MMPIKKRLYFGYAKEKCIDKKGKNVARRPPIYACKAEIMPSYFISRTFTTINIRLTEIKIFWFFAH
jgi:hypothetical protein